MSKLGTLARLIRSKNAGPFMLTFDVMFDDEATYQRVKQSNVLNRDMIAHLYDLPASDVMFFYCDNALAIKASMPRAVVQGNVGDSDGHGGQQYAPLIDVEVP